jgi:hypothetical protein
MIRTGQLPSVKLGRPLISRKALERFLARTDHP